MDTKHDVALAMLAEAREDIAKADQKASLVLAVLGIAVAALLGGVLAGGWKPTDLDQTGERLWWVGSASMAIGFWFSASAVWPRYDKVTQPRPVLYWADVAYFSKPGDFADHFNNHPPEAETRTLTQLWNLSRIVRRKYEMVRRAMTFSGIAIVLMSVGVVASARAGSWPF